jgi:hypothetical protein
MPLKISRPELSALFKKAALAYVGVPLHAAFILRSVTP